MSGHSRWAGIKHKKGAADAKRGKLFTKLIREITVAARVGGGTPEGNPRLRKAIESAREANMPAENVKKAIQRGTGEIPGATYEELMYEGYGPAGVAIMVEVTTDNKNRTAGEIRRIFSQQGGNLGESGCVGWMFSQKGNLIVEKGKVSEEKLMSSVLEAGAEDMKSDDPDVYEITTSPGDFKKVRQALEKANIPVSQAEITLLPQSHVKLTGQTAEQMLALMNALEEHEDIKAVYANFDISKEIMEHAASS